ncbi:MAG: hypothetical protein FWD17_19880, partial [Polyangiaceae bacterium]|nr:hypothetical protein [Polyangiaceae bacterium]
EITLQPGCHLIELFAPDPRAAHPATANVKGARLDLDAEMRNGADDRLMARDRSDAPDAQLPVCVGETTEADVAFIGAPTEAAVLVTHVGWPLPEHLPAVWGADARARSARILLARHVASLPSAAVQLAQGGSGVTPVPLSVEPGGCYVAVVALVQGSARGLGLHVGVGARSASDDRGVEGAGAAVAFCAGERSVATAEVEAHGTPLFAWGLALYRLSSGVWVAPR